jgi:Tfp pilus assembly protein PilW
MSEHWRSERGLTLIELTVVTVLATVVLLGLTGFYLSSQFTWIDGSAKAMAQREGTFLIGTMRDSVHTACSYDATSYPNQLSLYKVGETTPFYMFRWNIANDPVATDSLMYAGETEPLQRLLQSKVRRFDLAFIDSSLVQLTDLEVVSATGETATFSSSFALLNWRPQP